MPPTIRAYVTEDAEWARALLTAHFGAPEVVSRGVPHDASALPGFVAEVDGARAGLITYRFHDGDQCEVVALIGPGTGAELLTAATARARELGCRRMWLITTNDNARALRFYQRRGWDLAALHRNAVTASRRLKPAIPEVGQDDIPIRHELELELLL
jgi:ribosomal protein S18 acetylase RimI-like enzyme